jgi:hypothetical protein
MKKCRLDWGDATTQSFRTSWQQSALRVPAQAILRREILIRSLTGVLAFGTVGAFAQTDGPKARFEDDLISKLEGSWNLTRKIRGTVVQNSVAAHWVLNHQFLYIHMKDVKDPPAYEAIVLIGFIHAIKKYVAHWTDTFGGKFSAIGTGERVGNSVEFRFDYPDGPFFNTFSWSPDKEEWTLRGESQDASGQRRLFALDTLARK